jgi:hypothetical protein
VKSLENDNSYFDANLKIDQSIIFWKKINQELN